MVVDRRLAGAIAWVERERTARLVGRCMWPVGVVLLIVVGRRFWFAADDWAFLYTRQRVLVNESFVAMIMRPQDGHWMVWPILTFRLLHGAFGVGSYWPYLVPLWITHVGCVLLARVWMGRLGVSAWSTTLMTAVLLLFGAGWENLFFAVQIVYGFSMLAFLGQMLLVDHDGPVDQRDWWGALLGCIGVSSSGFGAFFAMGVGVLLVLRRRWRAALVAVVPQAVLLAWWWLTWGDDPAGDAATAGPVFVSDFVYRGVYSTFASLVGSYALSWSAVALCVAVAVWPRLDAARRMPIIALLTTALVMYAGVGWRRAVFGVGAAAWPRYQYMVAMMVAPVLALGLDQARRFAPWARWLPRLLLVWALARNTVWLSRGGNDWAAASTADRELFSLVAGSPQLAEVRVDRSLSTFSPDVLVIDIPELVKDGAITPRPPATEDERDAVARALGLTP